jgi:hypothetical protein
MNATSRRGTVFLVTTIAFFVMVFMTLVTTNQSVADDSKSRIQIPTLEDNAGKPQVREPIPSKPLTSQVKNGLAWLASHQNKDGGWSQGEESSQMGNTLEHLKDVSDSGDTCMALLAFIRAGYSPAEGPYADQMTSGIDYVCRQIEASDDHTLFVTDVRNTRMQQKLGTYIDTFMSSLLLSEVAEKMPDEKSKNRVAQNLKKVLAKMEMHQKDDGSFGGSGWANTLSVSIAGKGVNRAAMQGFSVSEKTRLRFMAGASDKLDRSTGRFTDSKAAGINLYSTAANLDRLQESDNVNREKYEEIKSLSFSAPSAEERASASARIRRYDQNSDDLDTAARGLVEQLGDDRFIAGFGTNGGEEYLSYMMISESLFARGGKEWEDWDSKITTNLNHIQEDDGAWTGRHCITGGTFCTSAALLTLMADRSPVPGSIKADKPEEN